MLLGHFLGAFSPSKFYFDDTLALLTMLIVGGQTTVSGALGGTVVVTLTIEMLRRLEGGFDLFGLAMPPAFGLTQAGLCVLILLVMYWRPAGLLGLLGARRAMAPAAPPAAAAIAAGSEAEAPDLAELRVRACTARWWSKARSRISRACGRSTRSICRSSPGRSSG